MRKEEFVSFLLLYNNRVLNGQFALISTINCFFLFLYSSVVLCLAPELDFG